MAETELQVSSALARPETFAPRTLDEAMRFAELVLESGLVPKSYVGKSAATVVVALQFGMELGMQPLQSLQNIASINGQPGVWGDAALALVLSSGLCEYYEEDDFDTIKKNQKATFTVKRRGFPKPKTTTFSYEDAKTAGIFTNAVWKTYPYRMCQMRARSFGLRDSFPDVLKGLELAEALQDYPGPTIDAQPTTAQTAQQEKKAEPEAVIGKEQAVTWYKLYKAHGHSPEESKAFLKEAFGIEAPKTSEHIPVSGWEKALGWAKTNAPIRVEAEKAFEALGFTPEESGKFCIDRKWDWPKIVAEAKAEIDQRNAKER